MTFCTQADVEKRLQWDITAEPEDVVTTLITAAQALIESETDRTLESTARVEKFDGSYHEIYLTHWPVTAIASVTEDGTTLTVDDDYVFDELGRLVRVSNGIPKDWQNRKVLGVEVTYTGGFLTGTHDLQLEHLRSICTEVVARAFRQGAANAVVPAGAGLGGISEVKLDGSDTVKYSAGGADIELGGGLSRFLFLLEDEKTQLNKYRNPPIA